MTTEEMVSLWVRREDSKKAFKKYQSILLEKDFDGLTANARTFFMVEHDNFCKNDLDSYSRQWLSGSKSRYRLKHTIISEIANTDIELAKRILLGKAKLRSMDITTFRSKMYRENKSPIQAYEELYGSPAAIEPYCEYRAGSKPRIKQRVIPPQDVEVIALAQTIPVWRISIDRVLGNPKTKRIDSSNKTQLWFELSLLMNTINKYLDLKEEETNEEE